METATVTQKSGATPTTGLIASCAFEIANQTASTQSPQA